MAGGVGTSISFVEFLSASENVLFCLLMSLFVFASWIMKGINNRTVIFCWAILIVLHHWIYWWIYAYFYNHSHNIYVLNLAGPVATAPAVLFLRFRVTYTLLLAGMISSLGILRSEMHHYAQNATVTDFEIYMKRAMYCAFIVEFLYATYLSAYSLIYQIPVDGSVYNQLLDAGHWDPYYFYHAFINIVAIGYILIICFYLFRDRNYPDDYLHGATLQDKQAVVQEILDEVRRGKQRKDKKERDQNKPR